MNNNKDGEMKIQLMKAINDFIKPVDIEELIKIGAIKKEGAWYRVLNPKMVPDHFMKKASRSSIDEKGLKVKLFSQLKISSTEKKFRSKGII